MNAYYAYVSGTWFASFQLLVHFLCVDQGYSGLFRRGAAWNIPSSTRKRGPVPGLRVELGTGTFQSAARLKGR